MSQRVVVVGGRGFLGSRTVAFLRGVADLEVAVAGRSGPDLVVDAGNPETFAALRAGDVVVNVSSSHAAPPDALVAHCLREGLVMLEASSDRAVVERLLQRRKTPAAGTVVLGAGIFTGLSNLVGRAAVEARPGATGLEIGIRSSPFSGAGQGTIDLMVDAMALPARVVRAGVSTTEEAACPGPVLPFPGGARWTLSFSFPEVAMLHASTGVSDVSLGFAPAPSFLWPSFRWLPGWLMRSGLFRKALGAYFVLLRRFVLHGVGSRVELVARSRDPSGKTSVRGLVAEDGMAVGGAAIAAFALHLARTQPLGRGVVLIDEVVGLDEALAGIRALAPQLTVRLSAQDG